MKCQQLCACIRYFSAWFGVPGCGVNDATTAVGSVAHGRVAASHCRQPLAKVVRNSMLLTCYSLTMGITTGCVRYIPCSQPRLWFQALPRSAAGVLFHSCAVCRCVVLCFRRHFSQGSRVRKPARYEALPCPVRQYVLACLLAAVPSLHGLVTTATRGAELVVNGASAVACTLGSCQRERAAATSWRPCGGNMSQPQLD